MATVKITKRSVDALASQATAAGRTLYAWDDSLTGFGMLATKAGSVSYFVEYRLGGRGTPNRRMSLGKHGPITPDQARKLAKDKLGDVAKGRDVAAEKKDAARKLQAGTLAEAAESFLSMNGNGRRPRYWSDVRRLIEFDVLPILGKRPVSSITRAELAALIDGVSLRSPAVARSVYAALNPLFKWLVERSAIEVNPMTGLRSPALPKARERTLEDSEIRVFWRACERLEWPFGPLFKLLLLTGQRRTEVAGMTWAEIDLAAALWVIPKERTKNGRPHRVALAPAALDILRRLPRNGALVFSTTLETAVSGFSRAKRRLDGIMLEILQAERPDAALAAWRSHDLRRTAATGMAGLKFPPQVIERVLNHVSGVRAGLTSVYQRFEYADEQCAALAAWGARIEQLTAEENASGTDAIVD